MVRKISCGTGSSPIVPIIPFCTLSIYNKVHLKLSELDFSSTKIFINLVQRYGSSGNMFLPLQLVSFEILSFFFCCLFVLN